VLLVAKNLQQVDPEASSQILCLRRERMLALSDETDDLLLT
jgi:hypothetical protein